MKNNYLTGKEDRSERVFFELVMLAALSAALLITAIMI